MEKLTVYKKDIVEKMVKSIEEQAKNHNVNLSELDYTDSCRMVNSIDDLFQDGGEIRCEQFTDFAWPYAEQFDVFDGDVFHVKCWNCYDTVYTKMKKKYNKKDL